MVVLINAFLPGNCSSGASKSPFENASTQAMAFFFTVTWPATMSLTPRAMAR